LNPANRRISKTIGGVTTGFLYDGANMVQELSGDNPSASLLTGGLDEVFVRADTSTRNFLTDGLGSTLALTDQTGAASTQYTYEPFGNASQSGTASGNPSQYTGRENDGTGLYFYRARCYSQNAQRFVSQDPIGFAGGETNLYAYAGSDPINNRDPSGLQSIGQTWSEYEQISTWLNSAGENVQMTWNFATGDGPQHLDFGPGSPEVLNMMYAPGVEKARNFFKDKNACSGPVQPVNNYRAGFGLPGAWAAGLNPTRQFVGDYRVDIFPNGDGTTTFRLNNTTSFTSLVYGIAPSWSRDPFGRGWSLPFGNMSQTYHWTEPTGNMSGRKGGCNQ